MPAPTLVLVHGAWHGPWCWEEVTPLLDEAGASHVEVDLPFTGHDDDIAATREVLDAITGEKVLVGHSYGGLVISGAAAGRSDIVRLVYLCAFMPAEGETVFEALLKAGDLPHAKVLDAIVMEADGRSHIDPAHAIGAFFAECPPELAARAVSRLRPMEGASTGTPTRGAPWRTVPSTYVVCERDVAIPAAGQRQMALQAAATVVLDTDHSPFLSKPAETARILLEAAATD